MTSLANHQSNDYVKLTADTVAMHFNKPIVINDRGCWLWLGATDNRGYARYGGLLVHGYTFRKAGFVCERHEELCHTCPHKNCINPDHLYAGTHKQNMEDAAEAGVMGRAISISIEKRQQARELLDKGIKQRRVAEILGVSEQWVGEFRKGKYKYDQLS